MAIFNGYKSKAEAIRNLKESGFNIASGLSKPESNPKVAKNMKQGVLSSPLHFAPFNLSGFNVCPQASAGCIKACLHTAGNPAYMDQKEKARLEKTRAYFGNRKAFVALLAFEIEALLIKAEKLGMTAGVRLNATSDIPWERVGVEVNGKAFSSLMSAFPTVEFYDYTKTTKRALQWASGFMPSNYHITFSKSEANDSDCEKVARAGGNIAVVFSGNLPESYLGLPVIDGDSHDFRPIDGKGVVVGLKAKGKAKSDESGFVVRLNQKALTLACES